MTVTRANTAVYNALKPLVNSRVWPLVRSESIKDTPYIVYTPVSGQRLNTMQGYAGHNDVRMQIDIYTTEPTEGMTLAESVINTLDALDTVSAAIDSDRYEYEQETRLYRTSLDFMIWEQTQ